MRTAERSLLVL